jgi:hypothetical protein
MEGRDDLRLGELYPLGHLERLKRLEKGQERGRELGLDQMPEFDLCLLLSFSSCGVLHVSYDLEVCLPPVTP